MPSGIPLAFSLILFVGVGVVVFYTCVLPRFLTWLVDRYKIRPSIIDAMFLLFPGLFFLPMYFVRRGLEHRSVLLLSVMATALLSFGLGYVIETLRRPPPIEYWPMWYFGEGNPNWVRWRPGMKRLPHTQQFTMSLLATTLTIFCLLLGLQSSTISRGVTGFRQQRAATLLLTQVGEDASNNSVNLMSKGLTREEIETVLLGFKKLSSLNLYGTDIDDSTMKILAMQKRLTVLNISETPITDEGLKSLSSLPLSSLRANNTKITGEALERFSAPQLRWLSLARCEISSEGLRHIARLKPSMVELTKGEYVEATLGPVLDKNALRLHRPGFPPRYTLKDGQFVFAEEPPIVR